MSALMWACYSFEDHSGDLVKTLLEARADANASDNYGTTVLMHSIHGAAQVNELIKNVSALIRAGARVNDRNTLGQTALSIAEKDEAKAIIDVLKSAGAKP